VNYDETAMNYDASTHFSTPEYESYTIKISLQYQKFCTYCKFLTAIVHDKANKIAKGLLIFVYLVAGVVRRQAANFSDV
jgi:hypothetical protein